VGDDRLALVKPGETLLEIAFHHRVGFESIARLNPGVDPWIPLAGTVVRLPTRLILPDAPPKGLLINLPEMRLYDFTVDPPEILAVAVGDASDPSPVGDYRIGEKRVDPAWNVPESIRREKPELPPVVPPGPDNPLGTRWMTIGTTSYGIHGTNVKWSIGREATHGCIRLYEDEMQSLFERTRAGTAVRLVYQPFKWGLDSGRLHVEIHADLYGRFPDRMASALAVPRALGLLHRVDVRKVWDALDAAEGMPVDVELDRTGDESATQDLRPGSHSLDPSRARRARRPSATPDPSRELGATWRPTS
jgi:L,D-transpeptidase ErfK/SrfK